MGASSLVLLVSFLLSIVIHECLSKSINKKTEVPFDSDLVEQAYFIDKTDLLLSFLKNPNNTYDYISCPSGFGKTTNLLMIKAFTQYDVDDLGRPRQRLKCRAYHLFKGTRVDQELNSVKDDISNHPVIFASFRVELPRKLENETTNVNETDFVVLLNEFVYSFVAEFQWLKKIIENPETNNPKVKYNFEQWEVDFMKKVFDKQLTEEEIPTSLYSMIKILFNFFKKRVIVLVDDYDYVAFNAILNSSPNSESFQKIIEKMLRQALDTGRDMISYAMLVGVSRLPLQHQNITGNLPLNEYAFLSDHKYDEIFGYNINDMRRLSTKHKCDKSELQQIQDLYEGYETKIEHRKIFSAYSLSAYFKDRGYNTKIRPLKVHWNWGEGEQDFVLKFLKVSAQFHIIITKLAAYNSVPYRSIEDYPSSSYDNLIKLSQRNYEYLADEPEPVMYLLPFCFEHGLFSHTIYDDEYVLPSAEVHQRIAKTLRSYYQSCGVDFKALATALMNLLDCSVSTSKTMAPELKATFDSALKIFANVASRAPTEYLLQSIIKQTAAEQAGISITEDKKISRKGRCEVIYSTRGDRSIAHIAIASGKTAKAALKQAPGYGRKKHSTKSIYVGINVDSNKETDILIEVKTPR